MLLALVAYFSKPVKTSLWAVWAEQLIQHTSSLAQTKQEGNQS